MSILGGFLFWLGKILAEVTLVLGTTVLTMCVICAIVLIVSDISRKRKLKK